MFIRSHAPTGKMNCNRFAAGLLISFMTLIIPVAPAQTIKYPASKKAEVSEDYHGTKVADPYRWLENAEAEDTQAWVAAQNVLTFSYLEKIPARELLEKRLTELWNYPRYSVPVREGRRYFFSKNDACKIKRCSTCRNASTAKPAW